ncbi:MAG: hypothetical protein R2749_18655 [Acidimicrobiales bacterium]
MTVTDDGQTHAGMVGSPSTTTASSAAPPSPSPGRPQPTPPGSAVGLLAAEGKRWWPLDACRQLDDAMLHLRANEAELGTWVLRTEGDTEHALVLDAALADAADHWLVREIRLYWARTLRRLDLSARTLITLIEPGSCFAGTLAELAWAADRTLQYDDLEGELARRPLTVDAANDGWYPMANGLTRLQSRFWESRRPARRRPGRRRQALDATAAASGPAWSPPRWTTSTGRRDPPAAERAGRVLTRCAHRHGGQPALRGPRDDGDQDLRPPHRLAELECSAAPAPPASTAPCCATAAAPGPPTTCGRV